MKKTLVVAAALALALVGCGSSGGESKTESTKEEAKVEAATTEETTEQTTSSIKWTEAATAEDAAKGAGFAKFGVFDEVTLGQLQFKDPKFSYADGVAQAVYGTPATELTVRKADGTHTAPLTDRDKTEFAAKWAQSFEGVDVMLYGATQGSATVITWNDGTQDFCVTYQGLGGEEMTMTPTEVGNIVKLVKAANATTATTPAQDGAADAQKTTEQDSPSTVSESEAQVSDVDAVNTVESLCGGTATSWELVNHGTYGTCWKVGAMDENGNTFIYYVSMDGQAHLVDEATGIEENDAPAGTGIDSDGEGVQDPAGFDNPISRDDAIELFEAQTGATASSAEQQHDSSLGWVWSISGEDADGTPWQALVDSQGNVLV